MKIFCNQWDGFGIIYYKYLKIWMPVVKLHSMSISCSVKCRLIKPFTSLSVLFYWCVFVALLSPLGGNFSQYFQCKYDSCKYDSMSSTARQASYVEIWRTRIFSFISTCTEQYLLECFNSLFANYIKTFVFGHNYYTLKYPSLITFIVHQYVRFTSLFLLILY